MARIVQVILRIRLQRIVTTAPDLAALAARLAAEPRVGLDTEFLRERTYRAQLCLVQLSSPGDALCVDPLALTDLTPLAGVLASSAVVKVMHASRQDLEVLMPSTGLVRPVFDTQIAAALTGLPAQIGYAEAVRRLLGRELAKSHTRTDWSRRPLSSEQLEYALDDVRYLLPLAARLEEDLVRLGRLEWLAEELATLEDAGALGTDPDNAWQRLKGLKELDPARVRLARALAAWRERRAVDSNRPRGWILDDAVLREIILRLPRSLEALSQIPGMPAGVVKHRGEELLGEVRGADIPDPPPPLRGRPRPDPAKAALVKKLAAIIQAAARELDLVPEVLATRRDLEQLADGSRDIALLRGWRRAAFGERLLAAL
jgi:ribonuclease D